MAEDGRPLYEIEAPTDVRALVESVDAPPRGVLAVRLRVRIAEPNTWTDQWSFNASGVPTVCTSAVAPAVRPDTTTPTWRTQGLRRPRVPRQDRQVRTTALIQGLDEGVLPYDMSARGDQLARRDPGRQAGRGRREQEGGDRFVRQAAARSAPPPGSGSCARRRRRPTRSRRQQGAGRASRRSSTRRSRAATQWDFPAYPHVHR